MLLVEHELQLLERTFKQIQIVDDECVQLTASLAALNEQLWDVEDRVRILESEASFGEEFVELARKVYGLNDQRFAAKAALNARYGSDIQEQKSYKG